MDDAPTEVLTVTFPSRQDERAIISASGLSASLEQTQQSLAGQLARRSQRIYQTDVAAFLWWLRAHLAGEKPGRYQGRVWEARPRRRQQTRRASPPSPATR